MFVANTGIATCIKNIESMPIMDIATVTLFSQLFDTIKKIKLMKGTLDAEFEL